MPPCQPSIYVYAYCKHACLRGILHCSYIASIKASKHAPYTDYISFRPVCAHAIKIPTFLLILNI